MLYEKEKDFTRFLYNYVNYFHCRKFRTIDFKDTFFLISKQIKPTKLDFHWENVP